MGRSSNMGGGLHVVVVETLVVEVVVDDVEVVVLVDVVDVA